MSKSKMRGNGEGTIFKRELNGKTRWVTEYTLGKNNEGKLKRKTIYGKTRQEVKQKLEVLITEINTDKYVDKSAIIFKDLAKELVEDAFKFNKLSETSYSRKLNTYEEIAGHYIADMKIQKITEHDLKDFLYYITKYSNSVIAKIYGVVNNTFKRAVRKNIIKYNFLDDKLEFSKPKSKHHDKKVSAFTIEEQKQFLDVILNKEFIKVQKNQNIENKYQFLLSMYTGMRMGEINSLDIDDVDLKNNIIHVRRTLTKDKNDKVIMGATTKTGGKGVRDIVMYDQIKYIIHDYLDNHYKENKEHLLFYNKRGDKYFTSGQINSVFKRLCQKYSISKGFDVNQHMLRHTFATRCIEAGMPANVLQKMMGHSELHTTLEVYCDVFANYEKEHADRTYNYLKDNELLLINVDNKLKSNNI
ncbi:MAG: site-specific integrase [Bacilli bacterium]